jgi:hypothetical protein
MTHPKHDEDEHDGEKDWYRSLEPELAVLEIQAHLGHTTGQLWLLREVFADSSEER